MSVSFKNRGLIWKIRDLVSVRMLGTAGVCRRTSRAIGLPVWRWLLMRQSCRTGQRCWRCNSRPESCRSPCFPSTFMDICFHKIRNQQSEQQPPKYHCTKKGGPLEDLRSSGVPLLSARSSIIRYTTILAFQHPSSFLTECRKTPAAGRSSGWPPGCRPPYSRSRHPLCGLDRSSQRSGSSTADR